MSKVRIGMIGCGGRLRAVVKGICSQTDRLEVAALSDPSAESIRLAREMFNPDARVYADYHDLTRDPDLQWVMIGSWNCFHAEQAVAAMENGKHVFCEKPMATSLEGCLAMQKAQRATGMKFALGMVMRYSPHFRKLHEWIAQDRLGRILSMEYNETLQVGHGAMIHQDWRRQTKNAGGHLLEKCCHDIDLVNWMLDSVPVKVASFGGCGFFTPENEPLRRKLFLDLPDRASLGKTRNQWIDLISKNSPFTADKDIVDHQVLIYEYANGACATFHTNCLSALPERRMYICGVKGALRSDSRAKILQYCPLTLRSNLDDSDIDDYYRTEGAAITSKAHAGGDRIMHAELAATIVDGAPPSAGIREGINSCVAALAADEARAAGRVVDIRPYWEKAGLEWSG